MKIFAHSDNLKILRDRVPAAKFDACNPVALFGYELVANDSLPKDRPNGRIRFEGTEFDRADFRLTVGCVEYGPEDVDWMVMAGIIHECRELYFCMLNDRWQIRSLFDIDFSTLRPMTPFMNSI